MILTPHPKLIYTRYLVTLGSMWFLNSKASMVNGSVAEDEAVPKAVARTFAMLATKRNGSDRVKMTEKMTAFFAVLQ